MGLHFCKFLRHLQMHTHVVWVCERVYDEQMWQRACVFNPVCDLVCSSTTVFNVCNIRVPCNKQATEYSNLTTCFHEAPSSMTLDTLFNLPCSFWSCWHAVGQSSLPLLGRSWRGWAWEVISFWSPSCSAATLPTCYITIDQGGLTHWSNTTQFSYDDSYNCTK